MAAATYPNVLAPARTDGRSHERRYSKAGDSSRRDEAHQRITIFQPPRIPPPTLQKHTYSPTGRPPTVTPHDSANTLFPDQTYLFENAGRPYKASSTSSSASNSFAMTPISSNELEKSSLSTKGSDHRHSRKSSSNRDPEKGGPHHTHSSPRRSHRRHADPTFTSTHLRYADVDDADNEEQRRMQEAHAGRILFFLAFPCVVLSFLNAVWTLISLLITVLTQPVRLCARRPTFGQQLGGLVGPALNIHLRCIYTPLPPHADDDATYRPLALVAVQMLSPFLSFGMMVVAWVVAVFWLASAMIGDPVGLDRRDDGRDTVLGLRRWWERWLVRSIGDD